jgi:hypothetical protein
VPAQKQNPSTYAIEGFINPGTGLSFQAVTRYWCAYYLVRRNIKDAGFRIPGYFPLRTAAKGCMLELLPLKLGTNSMQLQDSRSDRLIILNVYA